MGTLWVGWVQAGGERRFLVRARRNFCVFFCAFFHLLSRACDFGGNVGQEAGVQSTGKMAKCWECHLGVIFDPNLFDPESVRGYTGYKMEAFGWSLELIFGRGRSFGIFRGILGAAGVDRSGTWAKNT